MVDKNLMKIVLLAETMFSFEGVVDLRKILWLENYNMNIIPGKVHMFLHL